MSDTNSSGAPSTARDGREHGDDIQDVKVEIHEVDGTAATPAGSAAPLNTRSPTSGQSPAADAHHVNVISPGSDYRSDPSFIHGESQPSTTHVGGIQDNMLP